MRRTVLVTGASRGIGRAIAAAYADAGHDVIAPPRAELDLASADSIRSYLKSSRGIDALVNNAGENKIQPLARISLEDWQRTLTVNLTAAFLLIQAFAEGMASRGWGRIVNVASCYSLVSRPGRAAYTASKAGLAGLTRAAALEYGPKGILVNAVAPGFVDTEMTRANNDEAEILALSRQTALGRLASPAEVAALVYFLGSDANTYMTGQTVVLDGGFTIQ